MKKKQGKSPVLISSYFQAELGTRFTIRVNASLHHKREDKKPVRDAVSGINNFKWHVVGCRDKNMSGMSRRVKKVEKTHR